MDSAHNAPLHRKDPHTQHLPGKAARRSEVDLRLVFEKKYEFYVGLAYSMLRVAEEAEDIVADVFHKALNEWESQSFMGVLNLEAYLTTCVQNACRNWIKREKIKRSVFKVYMINATSIYHPMTPFDLDMEIILKLLSPRQGETLVLYIQGYTHEEIAETLQCTEGASRNALCNAKKKLRKLFGEQPDNDPDHDGSPKNKGKRSSSKQHTWGDKAGKHRSGETPGFKELLNYLGTPTVSERARKTIIEWLTEEENAIEIIRGIKIALRYKSTEEMALQMRNSKDRLRAQLFGSDTGQSMEDNILSSSYFSFPVESDQPLFLYLHKEENYDGLGWRFNINNIQCFEINPDRFDRKGKSIHRKLQGNHTRLIAPRQKTKQTAMETKKFIFDKFQDYVQEGYHEYCDRHGLSKTEDQFITFLIDQNLISMTLLQRYTIQRAFEQLCTQYNLPKTRAVDTLSDRFMLSERTVWNMLRIKKAKKK